MIDGTLGQNGEDALVNHLISLLPAGEGMIHGAGDDCAVVPLDREWDELLKTDVVVEGVHFLPHESPLRIGYKALARAISDIAAMGGLPSYALVTLLADSGQSVRKMEKIYEGLIKCARKYGVEIAGGETSSLPKEGLIINIALTGVVERSKALLRSTAKAGDVILCTGVLGGSLQGHHLDFSPRVREGRYLAFFPGVHAMMDISDGLAKDLPRLARASGLGFEVYSGALPVRPGCSTEAALNDGEDYELLFTLAPPEAGNLLKNWKSNFPETPLTVIGRMTADPASADVLKGGWEHFTGD